MLLYLLFVTESVQMLQLGCVDTKIMCRFLSRISAQTRRENAGGLSPSKFSRRSMRKILPKRCVLSLVSMHPHALVCTDGDLIDIKSQFYYSSRLIKIENLFKGINKSCICGILLSQFCFVLLKCIVPKIC